MFRNIKDICHDGKLAYPGVPDPGINILYFYINMANLDVIMLNKPSLPVCRCRGDHLVKEPLIIDEGILRWGLFLHFGGDFLYFGESFITHKSETFSRMPIVISLQGRRKRSGRSGHGRTIFKSKWLSEHLFLQNFPGGVSQPDHFYHSRTTSTLLPPGLHFRMGYYPLGT